MQEKIKVTENDIIFLKSIVDIDANVLKCRKYIKENFNIDSEFIPEKLALKLVCNNINESLNLLAAKEHIYDTFTEHCICVEF